MLSSPSSPAPLLAMIERHAAIFGWSQDAREIVSAIARESWERATPHDFVRRMAPTYTERRTRQRFEEAGVPGITRLWNKCRLWWMVVTYQDTGCSMAALSFTLGFSSQQAMNRWLRLMRITDGRLVRPRRWVKLADRELVLAMLYTNGFEFDNPGWRTFTFYRAEGAVTVLTGGNDDTGF